VPSFLSNLVKVVSFYTMDTPYEKEVEHLRASCEKFGLSHHIEGIKNLGSWEKNCAFKPFFLRAMLEKYQMPIFWVDADAVFLKEPDFDPFLEKDLWVYKDGVDDDRFKIRASSIFINATAPSFKMVNDWCSRSELLSQDDPPAFFDQITLLHTLENETEAQIGTLPLSYCRIFDFQLGQIAKEDIVIEQYQASRRFHDFYLKAPHTR